ncbi:MAG: hypothetical protein LBK60_03730 [Verrucomicrobiales bacterium]|jgi:type II secretory pathway pseudopilin PulG|nr:hypothetical protein [Verrucomicrobiales bacterium]
MKDDDTTRGFSLVEVTLALGVVTFCLLALVGLLPMGLDTVKVSNDESAAINCLEQITASIRRAQRQTDADGDTVYEAAGAYRVLRWTLGGAETVLTLNNLAPGGFPSADNGGRKYVARVKIFPPRDLMTRGAAQISVAWPAHAEWNEAQSDWQRAQGRVYCWLVFLPR